VRVEFGPASGTVESVVYEEGIAGGPLDRGPLEVRPVEGGSALRFDGTIARWVRLTLAGPG
jgi:hypothetical protein